MTAREVDVLVAGARCAGATLANFLARKGVKTLVVEKDTMPSDQPMSTHFIGTYGMSVLDELGIGDKVRAFSSPVPCVFNGVEETVARIDFPKGTEGTCPRRTELDMLLVEEARAAGAEVQLSTKLVDVVKDGERVVGGVVEHDGVREEIRCKVLVGADGRHSKVAELVGANEYKGYETPRGGVWAYWPRPAFFADDPRYRGGAAIIHVGDEYRLMFPTNRDQLVIGIIFPIEKADEWSGKHREVYLDRVRSWSFTKPLTKDAEPLGKPVIFVKGRFFFRRAAGLGWALVGDAGLFKDPAPGLGITDAFRDARALAVAIAKGTDQALVQYWRERDVASLELFEFAKNLGTPGYNNPLTRALFEEIRKHEHLQARIRGVHERTRSPFAVFKTSEVVRASLREILRGRFGVVRPFLDAGKNGAAVAKELAEWRELARGTTRDPAVM